MSGIYKCPIHGKQPPQTVCIHLWQSIQTNILPTMKKFPIFNMEATATPTLT